MMISEWWASPVVLGFVAFFVLGVIADMVTTHIALKKGFTEWNPIMAKTGHPVLVSGIVSALIAALMVWVAPHEPSKTAWFCGIFGLYRWGCAAWNFTRLRKKAKATA